MQIAFYDKVLQIQMSMSLKHVQKRQTRDVKSLPFQTASLTSLRKYSAHLQI